MDIESIIRNIVAEILPLLNKRILIVISGGTINTDILLNTLANSGLIKYDILITDAAIKMIDGELIKRLKGDMVDSIEKLDSAIMNASFILIPVMTRNTLAKAALGIADNLATTGIARAIMMGKEIIAVRDSYDPRNVTSTSVNSVYNSMFFDYEKALSSFGVKIIDSNEFSSTIRQEFDESLSLSFSKRKEVEGSPKNEASFDSSILTLADIHQIHNHGTITVRRGTIITPLAKDYIYNNKLKVIFC